MIFSIFGKKNGAKKATSAENTSAKDSLLTTTGLTDNTSEEFANSIMAQRHKARATERKIDAIEYEMSRDIVKRKGEPQPEYIPQQPNANTDLFDVDHPLDVKRHPDDDHFETTMPLMGAATEYLLGANTEGMNKHHGAIENIPALEEAAILFASEQIEATEIILKNLIENENYNALNPTAWLMLFDLYQITNEQTKFEQLSLEYVSKLEISAPIWVTPQAQSAPKVEKGFVPGVSFSGKLNDQIGKQVDKLIGLAKQSQQLRLEFVRITEVSAEGCELLLKGFQALKKAKQELTVIGAADLIKYVRSLIAVGRRDASEAPWLLLLELLQLVNDEAGFEEASIDYCITYEVSPPSFEAPKNKSTAPSVGISIEFVEAERFALPKIIAGNTDELIGNIAAFAKEHHSVQLDCSQLDRIDFSSCGSLLTGLIPISKQLNVSIEFHEANHLVIALLNAMGFKNVAIIFPRKR